MSGKPQIGAARSTDSGLSPALAGDDDGELETDALGARRSTEPEKKKQGASPAENFVDPNIFPNFFRFIVCLTGDAALLRVRVPPETWTTQTFAVRLSLSSYW
jgi:hypothetical protein